MQASIDHILCIDDEATFASTITDILGRKSLLKKIHEHCGCDEINFRKFWNYLDANEGPNPLAESSLSVLCEELMNVFTHIKAYHGCRMYPESTYDQNGILCSSPEKLIEWAIQKFGDREQVTQIVKELGGEYISHNSSKVYAVKSMRHFQENGGYCHAKGSELLGIIAKRMTPSRENELYAIGEPSIIEFLIPIRSLEPQVWRNYVSDVFALWLMTFVECDRPNDPRMGGIILNRDVPPEMLLRRHLCDPEGKVTGEIINFRATLEAHNISHNNKKEALA